MKKPYLSLFALLLALNATAQNTVGWLQHYPFQKIYSVHPRAGGFLFFAFNGDQIFAGRTDQAGNLLQTIPFGNLPETADIIPVEGGQFMKASVLSVPDGGDILLEKFDSLGQLLWTQTLSDTARQLQVRLATLADGNVVVGGSQQLALSCSQNGKRLRYAKIGADGAILWDVTSPAACYGLFNNYHISSAQRIFPLSDGSFAVHIAGYEGYRDWFRVQKFDANGVLQWSRDHLPPSDGYFVGTYGQSAFQVSDTSLLLLGQIIVTSGGGHSSTRYQSYLQELSLTNGQILRTTFFPEYSLSQMFNIYAPLAYAIVGAPGEPMTMLVRDKNANRLVRLGTGLQDTLWERPLPDFSTPLFSLPLPTNPARRLQRLSNCGEVLAGGEDGNSIFLAKTDCWGNTARSFPIEGLVSEDVDFNCATTEIPLPAPNASLRLESLTDSTDYRYLTADSTGYCAAQVTAGHWRVKSHDHLLPISGFSCANDMILTVDSTQPATQFDFRIVRYKALLKGAAWFDTNNNCEPDDNLTGYAPQKIAIERNGTDTSYIYANLGKSFALRVDTGRYRLWINDYPAGPFTAYYCPHPQEVHFTESGQIDSVLIMRSSQYGAIIVKTYNDQNADCQLNLSQNGDFASHLTYKLTDTLTNEFRILDYFNSTSMSVRPGAVFRLEPLDYIPDTLFCEPIFPKIIPYEPGSTVSVSFEVLIRPHVFQDYPIICPGERVEWVPIYADTVFSYLSYQGNDIFLSLATHHVHVLDAPVTHLYQVDTTLATDSLQTLVFPAANGCDSTIIIHWLTSSLDNPTSLPPLHIQPNPAREQVIIYLPTTDFEQITVSNFSGKILEKVKIPLGKEQIELRVTNWSPGLYLLTAQKRTGQLAYAKLMVQY